MPEFSCGNARLAFMLISPTIIENEMQKGGYARIGLDCAQVERGFAELDLGRIEDKIENPLF